MEHVDDIKRLIDVMLSSSKFHLLIVQGAPGWAKTGTVTTALKMAGVSFATIGAYATPLALFNQLAASSDKLLLLDDTVGIFNNAQMLAMLCAASWPTGESGGIRRVKRTSTSERATAEFVDFSGKLIVITNALPKSPMVEALLNRSLFYHAEISEESIGGRLLAAATSLEHFPDQDAAKNVATFLKDHASYIDLSKVSLRTLEQGYELATLHGEGWRELLSKVLPKKADGFKTDSDLVDHLKVSGMSVEQQATSFCQKTGKSRRTFFYLRKKIPDRDSSMV